jgi:hypothetical protein
MPQLSRRSLFKLVPRGNYPGRGGWWRTVTINRGKEDGVEPEMPVLTDEGLVGKTTTVAQIFQWFCCLDEIVGLLLRLRARGEGILGERVAGSLTRYSP